MNATVVIPARYASTRLPGKPLLSATGKPLIQHVVEAVRRASAPGRIVVATDDERIAGAVSAFGGEAVMTRADHVCGTDRIAETVDLLGLAEDAIVLNVQGDEPDVPPECIDRLAGLMAAGDCEMATLAARLDAAEADDPNRVKVVRDLAGRAMYFSRSRIPFDRDGAPGECLLHLGLYAYRAGFIRRFARLAPTPAEQREKLEQLRALEHGHKIAVAVVDYSGAGIDTPADYESFVRRVAAGTSKNQ
jgi:3-deoxy-manno-octulosonate cytidylyltransferase (CMP-KDO synthetase)